MRPGRTGSKSKSNGPLTRRGARIDWDNTVLFADGGRETWHQSVRAYTLVELKGMLARAGFEMERVYGDFQGGEYSLDSPNMIIVSRKLGG